MSKRKTGYRSPNGRLRQPTKAEREAAAKTKEQEAMQTVLAQPHRRGNTSQLCASALGRFCLRMKLQPALYEAGQEYAGLIRRWRSAKGVPDPEITGALGNGTGPTPEKVREWTAEILRIETNMLRSSREWYFAVRSVCIDNVDPDATNEGFGVEGLMELARLTGWIDWRDRHPFAGRVDNSRMRIDNGSQIIAA